MLLCDARVALASGSICAVVIDSDISGCEHQLVGVCLVTPPEQHGGIFGFAEFVTGLALLVIVYTVTDVRYRFRIAVAPIPLWKLTFIGTGVIGVSALVTGLWFDLRLPVPRHFTNQAVWQAGFGGLFLLIIMTWMWFAFIRPPVFGKRNCRKYAQTLFGYILRGSDNELPIIGSEVGRSADALIRQAREPSVAAPGAAQPPSKKVGVAEYARDILLLIGNRKFCRSIVANSPGTAIAFFQSMTEHEKYRLPIGQFASNITAEAVYNTDSMLYHEDAGYYSGLIGYIKPFSTALYGNFELVEALGDKSPLDVDYKARASWDEVQIEAYGRAILITLEDYLRGNHWGRHSSTLFRAIGDIQDGWRDLYILNGTESGAYASEPYRRFRAVVNFGKDAVALLDKQQEAFQTTLRRRKTTPTYQRDDIYDLFAELMFDAIFQASSVKAPADLCWGIHHNTVWAELFGLRRGPATKIIQFKLRRLLYDEIWRLDKLPNYKSARILGFCLNVLGLAVGTKDAYGRDEYALRRVVLNWTKKNYLTLKNRLPDAAAACVMGSITFEEDKQRLVKTYAKGLSLEAAREYLDLDPPRSATDSDTRK